MAQGEAKRKLAVILSADVVGYSRLMEDDAAATVDTLTKFREVFRGGIERHQGRVVDASGDNLLAEFASPIEAVECAVEVQRELSRGNRQLAEHRRMDFRIGINLGDVLEKDGALFGDGVNIAARLEGLAEPGGICVSGKVHEEIEGKLDLACESIGEHEVKNIAKPVPVYRVAVEVGAAPARPLARRGPHPGVIAATAVVVLVVAAVVVWLVTERSQLEPEAVAEDAAGTETAIQTTAAPAPKNDPILAMPTGPKIAVLAFQNMSGDPEQEYFSDGIAEDIITELSRFDEFHVLARNSTFQYKGKAVDMRQIASELGADYVVEGSVRKAGTRVRVTAQLLDGQDGSHLWAESYDRELTADNIFEVQDEISGQIVTIIADAYGIITVTRLNRARQAATHDLGAYECVLQAHEFYRIYLNAEKHAIVRDCLERAVQTDPNYADAWVWLCGMYRDEHLYGFNTRPNALDRMEKACTRAIELDPGNQAGHAFLAHLYFVRHEAQSFFKEAEQAIEINPNSANVLAWMGLLIAQAGRWEQGIALNRKALALSHNPPGWMYAVAAMYHYRNHDYEAALEEALNINLSGWHWTHVFRAASYARLGKEAEAAAAIDDLIAVYPDFAAKAHSEFPEWIWEQEVYEPVIQGLREAGLDIPDESAAD
jgi:adenylate cyclase